MPNQIKITLKFIPKNTGTIPPNPYFLFNNSLSYLDDFDNQTSALDLLISTSSTTVHFAKNTRKTNLDFTTPTNTRLALK